MVGIARTPTRESGMSMSPSGRLRRWSGRIVGRRPRSSMQPTNPPIEKIAADLRRMLWRHDKLARSTPMGMSTRQLRALEAAISKSAVQAARGLGVSCPDAPAFGGFDTAELRRLLRALTAEGLMLPPDVGLIAQYRS